MTTLEKAQQNLLNKGIDTIKENNCLYISIDSIQLELSDYEVKYQSNEWDVNNQ